MDQVVKKDATKRAWLIVVGLGVIHGCGMGTILSGAGNFVPIVCAEFGFATSQFTLWTTFFGVFAAVAQLTFAGRLWLKVDARILLTVLYIITIAAYALMGAYSELWQWWLSGAIIGLAGGCYFTLSKQMICPNWFAKDAGKAIGVAQFIGLAMAAGSSPIQAMLIASFGWRMAYPIIAVICCILVLPFTLFAIKFSPAHLGMQPVGYDPNEVATDSGSENAPGMSYKKAIVTAVFIALFLCAGLNSLMGGFKTLYGSAAAFWGYDTMFAATMISIASLGAAIMNPIMGFIIDKIGPFKGGFCCLAFIAIASVVFIFVNNAAYAVIFAVFVFECQSPLLASAIPLAVKKSFGPREYPKIFANVAVGMSFIGAFSSPIVALIFEQTGSFDGAYIALLIVVILLALLLVFVATAGKKLVWDYPAEEKAATTE